MRRLLLSAGVALMLASTAGANPSCVALVGMPVADCSAGGLSFSNFQIMGFSGAKGRVFLGGIDIGTNALMLAFNPMLGLRNAAQSLWLRYSVAVEDGTTIRGASLGNGGNPAFRNVASSVVSEWVCKDDNAGPEGCGSSAATLAFLQASGGENASASWTGRAKAVSVFKELEVPEGGSMVSFMQRFHTGRETNISETPEPLTFSLIGGGLVLLGALRRRSHDV